jgi:chorismate synthase
MIENTDQRSKDYSEIKDKYPAGPRRFHLPPEVRHPRLQGLGPRLGARDRGTVAAGAVARLVMPQVTIRASLVQVGPHKIDYANFDWERGRSTTRSSAPTRSRRRVWEGYLDGIRKDGNSVGAIIEVVAEGVPPGWGAPIYGKLSPTSLRR